MNAVFPPKTLALDYGLARIGLAVSHGSLAEPLKVIPNADAATIAVELNSLIAQENVHQLLVGVSAREMAAQTQIFIENLQRELSIPILTAPEAYSTKAATAKLKASTASTVQKKGPVDHYAAAEFLQEWLDEWIPGDTAIGN